MDELLTKDNIYYRDLARDLAEKHVRPVAAELDRTGEYPWSVIKALQETGLMGMWVPKDYGGAGAGLLNLCIVVEEISRACAGTRLRRDSYSLTPINCGNPVDRLCISCGKCVEEKKSLADSRASGRQNRQRRALRVVLRLCLAS